MTDPSTPTPHATVAVVIAAYNAHETIALAVRSALAQPEACEVWVIDDASTDDTAQLAEVCDDGSNRLKVVRQPANGGPSKARNVALARTAADWICVLDSDDVFAPGRLARLLSAADGVEMAADAITRVASFAEPPPPVNAQLAADPGAWSLIDLATFVDGNVSRKGRYRQELGFIKPLMSMTFLRRHQLSYSESLRLGEDFLLYAQILAHGGRLRLGPACGYFALTRSDSLSGKHSIDDLQALRDCTTQLADIRSLRPDERQALRRQWRSVDDRLQWRRLIEAVKTRDVRAALGAFHDPAASAHLVGQLLEQAWLRGGRRLSGTTKTAP